MTVTAFELPDDIAWLDNIDDPAVWERHAWWMPIVAVGWRWWFGDMIATAPNQQRFVELLNGTPGLEPGETVALRRVAELIPKHRRRPHLPWSYHAAIAELPAHIGDQILDEAETANMNLQDVRQAAARTRQNLPKPPLGPIEHHDYTPAEPFDPALVDQPGLF